MISAGSAQLPPSLAPLHPSLRPVTTCQGVQYRGHSAIMAVRCALLCLVFSASVIRKTLASPQTLDQELLYPKPEPGGPLESSLPAAPSPPDPFSSGSTAGTCPWTAAQQPQGPQAASTGSGAGPLQGSGSSAAAGGARLEGLRFSNRFTQELPADPLHLSASRQASTGQAGGQAGGRTGRQISVCRWHSVAGCSPGLPSLTAVAASLLRTGPWRCLLVRLAHTHRRRTAPSGLQPQRSRAAGAGCRRVPAP